MTGENQSMPYLAEGEEQEKNNKQDRSLAERLFKKRIVILAEPVSKELAEKIISKLILMDEEDESAPIHLHINSPGGDVDAGFAIFDTIRYISAPVMCISNGLVASAAVIILLAAKKENRLSLPNSRFLMHQPSTGVRGSTADIRIEANEIVKMREKINDIIALETGQDIEKVEKDTTRNYWINAEEAIEYGLISRVVSSRSDMG